MRIDFIAARRSSIRRRIKAALLQVLRRAFLEGQLSTMPSPREIDMVVECAESSTLGNYGMLRPRLPLPELNETALQVAVQHAIALLQEEWSGEQWR